MRYYRILHNFDAQDNVELTVKKGEIVTSVDSAVQDGWIKVEVLNDTQRHGFVPYNYIREVTQSDSIPPDSISVTTSAARQKSAEQHATPLSYTSAAMEYGDTLQEMHGTGSRGPSNGSRGVSQSQQSVGRAERQSTQSPKRESVTQPQQVQPQGIPLPTQEAVAQEEAVMPNIDVDDSILNDPNAIVDAFMKNELHFKQLMRQRHDALQQMRTTLEEAVNDLSACKEKNAVLASKLRELDQTVERERRKWKERIEEEKTFINHSIPREGSIAVPSQTTNTTSLGRY